MRILIAVSRRLPAWRPLHSLRLRLSTYRGRLPYVRGTHMKGEAEASQRYTAPCALSCQMTLCLKHETNAGIATAHIKCCEKKLITRSRRETRQRNGAPRGNSRISSGVMRRRTQRQTSTRMALGSDSINGSSAINRRGASGDNAQYLFGAYLYREEKRRKKYGNAGAISINI